MSAERQLRPQDVVELHPNFHFRWEEPQQAYVLLYPEGVVKLNETAGDILNALGGGLSIADLSAKLSDLYGGADLAEDVMSFLEVAYAKGWVRIKP